MTCSSRWRKQNDRRGRRLGRGCPRPSGATTLPSRFCSRPPWMTGSPRITRLGSWARPSTSCWTSPRSMGPTKRRRALRLVTPHDAQAPHLRVLDRRHFLSGDRTALRHGRGVSLAVGEQRAGLPVARPIPSPAPRLSRRLVRPGARVVRRGRVGEARPGRARWHEAEVAAMLAEAEAADEAFGADRRGDEVPPELIRRESRLAKMRAAKEAIEADARHKAGERAAEKARRGGNDEVDARAAAESAAEAARPDKKAQRNFTDPDARMMKTTDGFHYAYNAQAVVDEHSQVMLAADVTQCAADVDQLFDMVETTETNLADADIDDSPEVVLADAGYCSEDNLGTAADGALDMLIATGRLEHNERVADAPRGPIPKNATARERMARRLRTKKGRADYARRKAIVEPAFGQMKVRQHAGFLRLRGFDGVQGEWTLHAICHNLRKLANARHAAVVAVT